MLSYLLTFGAGLAVGWLFFKRPEWVGWVIEWVKAQVSG